MIASRVDRATIAGGASDRLRRAACAAGVVLGIVVAAGCRSSGEPSPTAGPPLPTTAATASSPVPIETPVSAPEGSVPRTADPSEFIAAADREAIQRTISAQIEALRRDDATTAFSFAAPVVQDMFETPAIFFRMVLGAYAPLYRPRYVRFGETTVVAGEITQKVLVVDQDGRPVLALYLMDRQADGTWRIMGCLLAPSEETPA